MADFLNHCWEEVPPTEGQPEPGTCLLPANHEGPHVGTPDAELVKCIEELDESRNENQSANGESLD